MNAATLTFSVLFFLLLICCRPFGAQLKPFLEMMSSPSGARSVNELSSSSQPPPPGGNNPPPGGSGPPGGSS